MTSASRNIKILIVDDEWESAIIKTVQSRLEEEGWAAAVVQPESTWSLGEEFELAALYAVEEENPDGVLLDVRFGVYDLLAERLGFGTRVLPGDTFASGRIESAGFSAIRITGGLEDRPVREGEDTRVVFEATA